MLRKYTEDVCSQRKRKEEGKMNKNVIIAVVLGVLVLIAALQAVQLFTLKGKLGGTSTGSTQGSAAATAPATSGPAPATPPNIQNLPQMVGGC